MNQTRLGQLSFVSAHAALAATLAAMLRHGDMASVEFIAGTYIGTIIAALLYFRTRQSKDLNDALERAKPGIWLARLSIGYPVGLSTFIIGALYFGSFRLPNFILAMLAMQAGAVATRRFLVRRHAEDSSGK